MTYFPVQPGIEFYATRAGGRAAFAVGTGFVAIASSAEAAFCAIENPAGSGMDVHLDIGEFSANQNTEFRRYVGQALLTRGTPETIRNLGGGTTASVLKMYKAGNYTAEAVAAANIGKVAMIQAFQTYFTELKGRSVLRPGRAVHWTIDGSGNGLRANVYFEWYELPAAAD